MVPSASRFYRLNDAAEQEVSFFFQGGVIVARPGDSVAAALLAAGHAATRTSPVSSAARGPFCMMGACFECLLEIDGEPNRQGCMVTVSEGMRVRRMGCEPGASSSD